MDIDWLRGQCLALPHATEQVQWGDALVFKVAGKMFGLASLEPGPVCLSFKCAPEEFAELVERPGIVPAPYLARASWVALEHEEAMPSAELKQRLRQSYDLVVARLPKKEREKLSQPARKAKTKS